MLNNQKVKLMTRLAIYEKKHNIINKNTAKCFKTDYVTFGVLRTVFAVTVAYVICVGLFILYNFQEFMEKINSMDYAALGKTFFSYYCVLLIAYIVIALVVYSVKYDRARLETRKYYNNLKKLEKISDK
jgi:formate hydrogenlyase subunit 3/multisubunit Na+/H+ antiporter MnhD subunit